MTRCFFFRAATIRLLLFVWGSRGAGQPLNESSVVASDLQLRCPSVQRGSGNRLCPLDFCRVSSSRLARGPASRARRFPRANHFACASRLAVLSFKRVFHYNLDVGTKSRQSPNTSW